MITKCKCGGKMRPRDENSIYFRWRCDKCKRTVTQRKRKAKKD